MRIIGGTVAQELIPWAVAVFQKTPLKVDTYTKICGGTILDENTVLTAAHCFKGRSQDKMYIQAGLTNVEHVPSIIAVTHILFLFKCNFFTY